ncbi:hypothetical protein EJB05_56222 [Eragrostis curvula]|uniref:Uncharacterized protein n=1 Tax=Eragrostis curvula TaxID=38414 RepID=A0A5J9SHB7_9POAL|nr:hypothetical protein EJB05_56222 [Eragrostis curvula]
MPSPSPFVSWSSSGEPALSLSTSSMDRSDGARTRGTTLLASVTTTMWPSPRTRPARARKRASAASDACGRRGVVERLGRHEEAEHAEGDVEHVAVCVEADFYWCCVTNGVERTTPVPLSAAEGPRRSVLVLLVSWNSMRQ